MVCKSKKTKSWMKRHKPEWLEKLKKEDIKEQLLTEGEEGNIYTGRNYGQSTSGLYVIDTLYRKYPEEMEISRIAYQHFYEGINYPNLLPHKEEEYNRKYYNRNYKYNFDGYTDSGDE